MEQYSKACDWRRLRDLLPVLLQGIQRNDSSTLLATDPYDALLYLESPAAALRVAREHVSRAISEVGLAATRYDDWLGITSHVRIGILSADMRKHPVTQTLLGVMDALRQHPKYAHRRRPVHLTIFSMCPDKPGDLYQQRIKTETDDWVNLHGMSDDAAAQRIADAGIHVLLEMQGHKYTIPLCLLFCIA